MEVLSVVVWVVIILALAGLALWGITYAPADFQRPLRIVVIAVAIIALIYLLGGLLLRMAPPFPGLLVRML